MIPKTMVKRSDIRSSEQLSAAIAASRAELSAQRRRLETGYKALKDRFSPVGTPVGTAAGFVERGRNLIAWSAAIISLVRTLRGRRKK